MPFSAVIVNVVTKELLKGDFQYKPPPKHWSALLISPLHHPHTPLSVHSSIYSCLHIYFKYTF